MLKFCFQKAYDKKENKRIGKKMGSPKPNCWNVRDGCKYEDCLIINLSPPGQNGGHFADDNHRCMFVNENKNSNIQNIHLWKYPSLMPQYPS